MTGPTQRYACDRCHGQKLRCVHNGKAPCVRCVRAKATCVWSQSLRGRRTQPESEETLDQRSSLEPEKRWRNHGSLTTGSKDDSPMGDSTAGIVDDTIMSSAPNTVTHDEYNVLLNSAMPGSSIDFNPNTASMQSRRNCQANFPSHASQQAPGSPISSSRSTTEASSTISAGSPIIPWSSDSKECVVSAAIEADWRHIFSREWELLSKQESAAREKPLPTTLTHIDSNKDQTLAPLMLDTVKHLSKLQVELFAHCETVPKPPVSMSQPLSWKDKDFAIDRTFQLAQRFIDILNAQYPRFLQTAARIESQAASASSDAALCSAERPGLDQGCCLLILSCHVRLIDVFNNIFGNMQACLDRSSVTDREDYVNLPDVKVGSFTLPHSSAIQIVCILQLARNLLSRISEILKALGFQTSANDKDDGDSVGSTERTMKSLLSSAIETVTTQESVLVERIMRLRNSLISLNIL